MYQFPVVYQQLEALMLPMQSDVIYVMYAVYTQVYMKIYQGEELPEPKSMLEVS